MDRKVSQKVVNLDNGGTATVKLDIGYFPEKVGETETQRVTEFTSILSSLISSNLTSELILTIHTLVPLPVSHERVSYQCKDGLNFKLFVEEAVACEKYRNKPHNHYLCRVGKDSNATIVKRMKVHDSETTASVHEKVYGDFLKISGLPLQKIFSYLKLDDIKTCSLLSKDVRQLVFPSLIRASSLCLSHESLIEHLLYFKKRKIQEFNQNLSLSIDSRAFKNYSYSSFTLQKLFTGFGPHLSHLQLNIFYNEEVSGFQDDTSVMAFGPKLFPRLSAIAINFINGFTDTKRDWGQAKNNTYVPLIQTVLANAPELKAVRLSCGGDKWITSTLFWLVGESGLAIESLNVSSAFPTEQNLGCLSNLALQEVKFSGVGVFESNEFEGESFTGFLESQSHSLKRLVLNKSVFREMPRVTFPRMKALETLKLKGDFGRERLLTPINLNQLPNLKRIELKMDGPSVHDCFLNELDKCDIERESGVKEVILTIPGISAYSVRNCANAFKSLSKLEVPFDESFKSVWKDLGSLEELTLFPPEKEVESNDMFELMGAVWINEGIAGVGKVESPSKNFTDKLIEKYEEEYNPEKSIASMKKLRLLRLRPAPEYNSRLMLTDIYFRVALSKMKSLKYIDFCGTHPAFVGASKKVFNEMGQKIALLFGNGRDWYYQ